MRNCECVQIRFAGTTGITAESGFCVYKSAHRPAECVLIFDDAI